ncbi:UNVERIFIED_CONTAM: hypothetical protein K2H54_020661 [Gekko kuhli]
MNLSLPKCLINTLIWHVYAAFFQILWGCGSFKCGPAEMHSDCMQSEVWRALQHVTGAKKVTLCTEHVYSQIKGQTMCCSLPSSIPQLHIIESSLSSACCMQLLCYSFILNQLLNKV